MNAGTLHRLSAFSSDPRGGNPAGVWIGESLPDASTMQEIAAQVGYSETAFVAPASGLERTIRYYSPQAEVPFCGHATIATGVVLGETSGDGTYQLATSVGVVPVQVTLRDGLREASLTSVAPRHVAASDDILDPILDALGWQRGELDPAIAPVVAYAGAWHLILAVARSDRLARLEYPFETVKALMLAHDLTTLQLIHRQDDKVFLSRNPFPVGGVVEDPATGASAAALGGYLRDAGLLAAPASILIRQGDAMGRPSRIHVHIPQDGGIVVSGTATRMAPGTSDPAAL